MCLDGELPGPDGKCEDGSIGAPPINPPRADPGQSIAPTGACAPQIPYFPNLNDTCRWARDNECDEPQYGGTGACQNGTDTTDCRGRGGPGPDACSWSYNGVCNEARYGCNGACANGTDTADCSGPRNQPSPPQPAAPQAGDTCRWARDGECDDPTVPGHITTACAPGTDMTDCSRPADIGNSCRWARDGECDDPTVPGHLTTACSPGTDNADCGR